MADDSLFSLCFPVPDPLAMENLGHFLASVLQPGDLVCLQGELGAGKTTLVRGIARGFGYTGRVTSPTFTLMNQYDTQPQILHLDFYRLDSSAMVEDLGLEDYWQENVIILIEWPQIGMDSLPDPSMTIVIDLIEDDYDLGRQVTIYLPESQTQNIERLKDYVSTCH